MNIHVLGQALLFLLSVVCLWYFFFFMYRDLTVDAFRQKMFELRDQLFDEAANGIVPFDHPAYQVLRNTMNGFLRFGHRISLLEAIVAIVTIGLSRINKRKSFATVWNEASKSLTPKQRDRLDPYRLRMNELILLQSFFGSPFFVLFLVIGLVLMRFPGSVYQYVRTKTFTFMNNVMKRPLDEIESAAMAYGRLR